LPNRRTKVLRTITILILTLCAGAHGQCFSDVGFIASIEDEAGGAAPTYLFNQGAEGAGYDNSESWNEVGTVIDEDDATTPLVGSQSILINGTTARLTSPTFAESEDEVICKFRIKLITVPAAGTTLLTFVGPGVTLDLLSSGGGSLIRIGGSVNSPATVNGYNTTDEFHFKVRYRKDLDGGAASALYSVEFNTTGTFNGSGNDYTEATTGTETAQCTNVRWHGEGGTTVQYRLDAMVADDVDIP
jgi:hypothetical protein